ERTTPSTASARFDPTAGQLLLDGAGTSVEEALTPAGFLDVTVDGVLHTSDTASAAYDPALAGAAAHSLTSIRFLGAGTLVLGDQPVDHPLPVTAPALEASGAVTAPVLDLAATGQLDVEASGSLRATAGGTGGSLTAAADTFVNVGQVRADGATGG